MNLKKMMMASALLMVACCMQAQTKVIFMLDKLKDILQKTLSVIPKIPHSMGKQNSMQHRNGN